MCKALRLWIVIFVIICIWIYFLFISPKIFNNKILVVPNIIEMSEEEGIETLKTSKIKYKIIYLENQDNIVLRTMPYPNTKIKGNYEIEVFIGKVMLASYKSYIGQVYEDVKEKINIMCNNNGIKLSLILLFLIAIPIKYITGTRTRSSGLMYSLTISTYSIFIPP